MTDEVTLDARRASHQFAFDRHTPQYREQFAAITADMQGQCPIAWSGTYGGHWVAAGSSEVFELARCPHVSNDNDITGARNGYTGITIPRAPTSELIRGGFLERTIPNTGRIARPSTGICRPPRCSAGSPWSTKSSRHASTRRSKTARSTSSTTSRTSSQRY